jgi:hypothetical protein
MDGKSGPRSGWNLAFATPSEILQNDHPSSSAYCHCRYDFVHSGQDSQVNEMKNASGKLPSKPTRVATYSKEMLLPDQIFEMVAIRAHRQPTTFSDLSDPEVTAGKLP